MRKVYDDGKATVNRKWELPGKTISIELSSYCQARCVMCPFEDFPMKNRNMEFSLFKKCIDEGSEYGLEYITAGLMGDALLDPGIEEKFNYVREHYPNMKIFASSTGMSAIPDLVCKYLNTLNFSFYGTTKEVYEKVHRGGVYFERAMENVEKILERPREKRPYVTMTFLILPENEHQLKDWLSKWEPISDEVIVWKPHNWAGIHDMDNPTEDYLKNAKSCFRPFGGQMCIWVNGDVTPCCFSWDESMVIGNAYTQSLEEIYFGELSKRMQEIHKNKSFYGCGLACEKCDQLFSREDALVYTNKNRRTGQQIISEDYVVRFENKEESAKCQES